MKFSLSRFLAGSSLALLLACVSAKASAEVGLVDGKILVGMSASFTGVIANYGLEQREGVQAYFNQVNAAGGVNGRKLELVSLDDGYEPPRTVANTKKLIEENKVFALVGYVGTATTIEAMKVFSEAKVPLVGTISGGDALREPVNRYMFNVRASYADETDAIVSHLVSLGVNKIAVIYQNDAFGKTGLEGVTRALKRKNLAPVSLATVERNSIKVEPAVATIAKSAPQAVMLLVTVKPAAVFIKQMKATGLIPQFSTPSSAAADLLVQELGADARGLGISQVMPYPWNDTLPVVKDYQKAVQTYSQSKKLSYYGMEGYLDAKVLVEGIRRAGKDLTREKLVTALESMSEVDLGGFRVSYSAANHSGSRFVDLTVIGKDGKILH